MEPKHQHHVVEDILHEAHKSHSLAKEFFKDKLPPNIMDYDVIGFDIDHTLVKYKVRSFCKLLATSVGQHLIEKLNYPKEIIEFTEEELDFPMDLLVIDIKNGLIIKLGEGNRVFRAARGYRMLSKQEIEEVYGSPPIAEGFDPLQCYDITKGYLGAITYNEIPIPLLYAKATQLKEKGVIDHDPNKIITDLKTAHMGNFIHYVDGEWVDIHSFGYLYLELLKNPDNYIYRQPQVTEFLLELKKRGKMLFCATNGHIQHADFMMTHNVGKDWKDLFDLISVHSLKPSFFQSNTPFYEVDTTKKDFIGKEITEGFEPHKVYLSGNYKLTQEHFAKLLGKEDLKVLFVGDQVLGDCYYPGKIKNWDALAILEEIGEEMLGEQSTSLPDYRKYWGSIFFEEIDGKLHHSLWMKMLEDNSIFSLPLALDMRELLK